MRIGELLAAALLFVGCSSQAPPAAQNSPSAPSLRVPASTNPVAKSIELVGFRITEHTPGKLQIQFGVVNHSDADLGDVVFNVQLRANNAKDSDAPLVEFSAKAQGLGPQDLKPISVEVPSKLRPYELPDWQFIKADFRVVEPK